MTVDKLRFNLGNTNYDVPTKEYVDNLALNNVGNNSNSDSNQSINLSDTPIGYTTWQMSLLRDYLKLDGTNLANASTDYKELLDYAIDNELITNDSSNKVLFKYNDSTDILTLPNYIDLCLQGGNTVEEKEAGLPNIKGSKCIYVGTLKSYQDKSPFTFAAYANNATLASSSNTDYDRGVIGFDASQSNSIYSDSVNTVQPPAITLIPQIKYRKDTSNNVLYNDTPIGTIISYMGQTAPKDYLICDGTVYNIDDYKELAEFINTSFGSYNKFGGDGTTTFAVPDLRGEFLRGTGTNSHTNQGNGANVGSHQDGTVFNGFLGGDNTNKLTSWADISKNGPQKVDASTSSINPQASSVTNISTSTAPIMVYTSRPTNTSVLYCIKCVTSVLSTPDNNYSIIEQRIGTWIDGKPLYQITVDCGTLPNTTYKNIQTNISNVKDIIDIKGTCYSSSGFWRSMPKIQDDSTSFTVVPQISFDNNKMIVQLLGRGGDNASFTSSYVTIQYTKTID